MGVIEKNIKKGSKKGKINGNVKCRFALLPMAFSSLLILFSNYERKATNYEWVLRIVKFIRALLHLISYFWSFLTFIIERLRDMSLWFVMSDTFFNLFNSYINGIFYYNFVLFYTRYLSLHNKYRFCWAHKQKIKIWR